MAKFLPIFLAVACSLEPGTLARADLAAGIADFENHHWQEATKEFLDVLEQDPGNAQAHKYIALIARQVEIQQHAAVQDNRLQILSEASKRLDENRQNNQLLESAISDTTQAEARAREERWHQACETARMERDLGHLIAANDWVLAVLIENPSHAEAQRELSELQSRIHQLLDAPGGPDNEERFALEGFYAFGQADYAAALTAWRKDRAILESYSAAGAAKRVEKLRFAKYEKIAQAKVDEENRMAELRSLFERGVTLYENAHFAEGLALFRQVAIREPEYPQLGKYLVQAEAAAEKDRARRLGEEKRQQIARTMEKGISRLAQAQYSQAEQDFEQVLKLDASHPEARSYLQMARAEMRRRHDPKAAQMHYEAGLVDYASGKLEEAVREWRMAIRMDPQHEKATNALNKVQKELALNQEEP